MELVNKCIYLQAPSKKIWKKRSILFWQETHVAGSYLHLCSSKQSTKDSIAPESTTASGHPNVRSNDVSKWHLGTMGCPKYHSSSSINWVLFESKHWKKNNSCGVNVSPAPAQQAFARGGECLATARKTKAAAFLQKPQAAAGMDSPHGSSEKRGIPPG